MSRCDLLQQPVLRRLVVEDDLAQLRAEAALLQIGHHQHGHRPALPGDLEQTVQRRRVQGAVPLHLEAERRQVGEVRHGCPRGRDQVGAHGLAERLHVGVGLDGGPRGRRYVEAQADGERGAGGDAVDAGQLLRGDAEPLADGPERVARLDPVVPAGDGDDQGLPDDQVRQAVQLIGLADGLRGDAVGAGDAVERLPGLDHVNLHRAQPPAGHSR